MINSGAAYTSNRQITADLAASDDLSGVSQVAFSNDGASYGDWQGYASRWSMALPAGDGEKTLYARFKDQAGNTSPPAADNIVLDTTPPTIPAPDDALTGTISSPTVTLQWPPSSDALSGVERYYYRTDCGSEAATSNPSATTPVLFDGDHTFYVRAKDQAGNYSPYGKHALTIRATGLNSPDLYAPDSPTDRDKINISGVGPALSPIRLFLNCANYGETTSGNFGAWQFRDVPLALGENVMTASIVDVRGGLSPISLPAVVVRLKSVTATAPKTATSLLSSSGGTVSAGQQVLEVPAGALPGEAQVSVTPYGQDSAPPLVGKRSVGSFASIGARERGTGAPAQLAKGVRVSLSYDPASLGGLSPSQLAVHYYDPAALSWVALSSQVDPASRRVTAETTHLSDFGLLADLPPLPVKLYVPLAVRGSGGW